LEKLMITRRRFVGNAALSTAMLGSGPLLRGAFGQTAQPAGTPIRLAVLGSTYRTGSALQQLADRFLVGYPVDGEWHVPAVKVVSLFVDGPSRRAEAAALALATNPSPRPANGASPSATPDTDLSAARAKEFGFRVSTTIPDALRCGGEKIAVDAVLSVVEQDGYPTNDRGQNLLPHYDYFEQCVQVFEAEHHAVPYFNHRELSFSFMHAQSMVGAAKRLRFPLLAGSSMPVTWRLPDTDIPMGAPVQDAVMVGVGSLQDSGFDALEAMQSMLERRKGGESGVKSVQFLEGDDVWTAAAANRWSSDLLSAALSRSDTPLGLSALDSRTQDMVAAGVLPQLVPNPAALCIEYRDGTGATLLLLNGAIRDFNIAARVPGHGIVSTQFLMPPPPNHTDSAMLAAQIERMYVSGAAPHPAERTLLTTGIAEALMQSRHRLNQVVETPHLAIAYYAPA
jgi:hypothetical protein